MGDKPFVPRAGERPDHRYWNADYKERQKLNHNDIEELTEEMGEYSRKRFVLGRRFTLLKGYHGVPGGVCCTVVDNWPKTRVRWDRWDTKGYGYSRSVEDMHFDLDIRLQHLER